MSIRCRLGFHYPIHQLRAYKSYEACMVTCQRCAKVLDEDCLDFGWYDLEGKAHRGRRPLGHVSHEEAILVGRVFAQALEKHTLEETPADGGSVTVSAIFGYRAGQWQIISGVYTEKGH